MTRFHVIITPASSIGIVLTSAGGAWYGALYLEGKKNQLRMVLTASQKDGPLTITVTANVKQVLTILLAMYMFYLTITPANSIGIVLTLAGGAWYGALEYEEKKNRLRMV
ncbi:UAA transporter [Tulasnella sp. 417]|nr:UAA transporter [Tulasnella sp. 417]